MIEQQIQELSAVKGSSGPFLTLYMETDRHDESQRDRLRLFMKHERQQIRHALEGNGHDEQIEKGIRQIEQYVENSLQPQTRGIAIFTCPTDNFFVPIQLPVPVRPQLLIGTRPQLRQLTELRALYPPIGVALIDGKYARLFELEFGQILYEMDLEQTDMPRRHDQGGWSQANMQRHVQEHINRHHKEVAEILTKMVDQNRVRCVIISGQDRNLANFRGFLPRRVEEKVVGTLQLELRSPLSDIISSCQRVIHDRHAGLLRDRLVAVDEAAHKKGRGALGFEGVVNAANQKRLEQLYIGPGASRMGWRCTSCGVLGEKISLGCPTCGKPVLTVDLVEELIAAAQEESARVEFAPAGTMLDQHEGVGASLRF